MTKTKADMVRGEVNGYHPSLFLEAYKRYQKQYWLLPPKKGKVKNNGLDISKNKKRSRRVQRT